MSMRVDGHAAPSESGLAEQAFRMDGKTVVVTGGARGIGQAIALDLASAGGQIVVIDIDGAGAERTAATIQAAGGEAFGIQADVRRAHEVQSAVADTVTRFGAVDVLVANAGVNVRKPLL